MYVTYFNLHVRYIFGPYRRGSSAKKRRYWGCGIDEGWMLCDKVIYWLEMDVLQLSFQSLWEWRLLVWRGWFYDSVVSCHLSLRRGVYVAAEDIKRGELFANIPHVWFQCSGGSVCFNSSTAWQSFNFQRKSAHEWATRRSETVFFNRRLRFWLWLRGHKVISVADPNEVQHGCQQLCRIVMLSTTK